MHKGVYLDGHKREGVVEYWKLYLRKLEILEATHAWPSPYSDKSIPLDEPSEKKTLVMFYHDESMFQMFGTGLGGG